MNVIARLFDNYCTWIDQWNPAHFTFFVQAALLLGLPSLFCLIAFRQGSRSVFVQTVAMVVGVLVAISIQVENWIPRQPIAKVWFVTFCFVLLTFLPTILPRVLTPELGKQRKLRTVLYVILAGLFLLNFLSS